MIFNIKETFKITKLNLFVDAIDILYGLCGIEGIIQSKVTEGGNFGPATIVTRNSCTPQYYPNNSAGHEPRTNYIRLIIR